MSFQVIENTPGYLPDVEEPAIFESFGEAVAFANELAEELKDIGYNDQETDGDFYVIKAFRSDTVAPDLGRVITVEKVTE